MVREGDSALIGKNRQEAPVFRSNSEMPSPEHISRRMVEPRNLWIPTYEAEVIEVFDLNGKLLSLYDSEVDKTINKMEIRAIELGYNLTFINAASVKQLPVLPLSNVIDAKVVADAKGLFKRKDRMLEITFVGCEGNLYVAKINFDDQQIDEILNTIQNLKHLESDASYWASSPILVHMSNSQPNTVNVYSSTPFLAEGEEILWQNAKTSNFDGESKIIWIDTITNYRIFQYDYQKHIGRSMMIPELSKTEVTNTKKTFRKNSFGTYSLSSSNFFTRIHDKVRSRIVGDIAFYVKKNQFIAFSQMTDPETLSIAVMTLSKNQIRASLHQKEIQNNLNLNTLNQEIGVPGEDMDFKAGLLPVNQPLKDRGSAPHSRQWTYSDKTLPQQQTSQISNDSLDLNPNKIKINWSSIIGYDEIKHIIDAVLMNKNNKKTHVLISGHAGTSKTVFLKTIESSLQAQGYNVHYLDATTLSSSGVIEYMFTNDVTYCLLDELDKLEKEHQKVFLNLLESGVLQETKHKKIRKKEMKDTIVIATANDIERIMFPLVTRFLTLNIPKYTKDQFYEISIKLLTSQYGKTDEIALYIADQIWNIYTEKRNEEPNMRQCVQVASLTDNTKESIDPILQGIATYSFRYEE